MTHSGYTGAEEVRRLLTMFNEADTVYSVVNLDEAWFSGNTSDQPYPLTQEQVETYRALEGSGVRDTFVGIFSGVPRFSFYERFTFPNGKQGLLQKSYDRSKVSENFSLSFYNDRGLAYVVNQRGDILLRSVGMLGDHFYENIFEILTGAHSGQEDIDRFEEALAAGEPGSMTFARATDSYVYTYVPIETVDNWFLVSIVPESAITEEANKILMDSQQALMMLLAVLAICVAFGVAIWYTSRAIQRRDREIDHQAALIDIFSTYLSDRTQERKAQDNLSEALRMARAASEAKSAFLGSVSHDIRTPMNAILGFTSLLNDEADHPDTAREYAHRIDAAGQHLLSLINDVLDINKIESGSATLNLVELDLAEMMEEINAIIRPQAQAKDQTLEISVSPLRWSWNCKSRSRGAIPRSGRIAAGSGRLRPTTLCGASISWWWTISRSTGSFW